MKFNIEVDCTPQEARQFFGLPDVAPMQERLLKEMEERMQEAIQQGDADLLLNQWLPLGAKGMEQWQAMWSQLGAAAAGFQKAAKQKKN